MVRRGALNAGEAPEPGPWLELIPHAVPLLGVLLLDWSLFAVMLIYWMEMGLIIIFAMARVCWCGETPGRNTLAMAVFSPFYFAPALGFVFAFFMAVVTFFHGPEVITTTEDMPTMSDVGARILDEWLWVPIVVLMVDHVRHFARDWIRSGAFRSGSRILEMFRLYGTMNLMMLTLILAAALLMDTGLGGVAVAFVVLVRIGLEVARHYGSMALRRRWPTLRA